MTKKDMLLSFLGTQLIKEIDKLSLNEQRLLILINCQLATQTVRDNNSKLIVAAFDMANVLDLSIDYAYETLIDVTLRLYNRTITINDKKTSTRQRWRWISYGTVTKVG
jgi:hypothetical protein